MTLDSSRLHLAVQKSGRLSQNTRELLRGAGFRIQEGKNALAARVENFALDLLLVASPANPTGVVLPRDRLAEIAGWCKTADVPLVADEIYHGLTYSGGATTAPIDCPAQKASDHSGRLRMAITIRSPFCTPYRSARMRPSAPAARK